MDRINRHPAEEALVKINIDDMLQSLGWHNLTFARKFFDLLFAYPARRFAHQVLEYDQGVAELGLTAGARRLLNTYVSQLSIRGQENIPGQGPLLILSNHPGMTDTVALFASLNRPDLRILAADRPFLRVLPATCAYLIFIPEEGSGRMEALRKTAAHLRSGGAVLTFPGGKIEPDPQIMDGAVQALQEWSISVGLFSRMVPDLTILPVVVSGVLAPQAVNHPLTRLRRRPEDRERLGATIQILARVFFPRLWPVNVQVDIHPTFQVSGLVQLHDPRLITQAVIERIRPYYQTAARLENLPAPQ